MAKLKFKNTDQEFEVEDNSSVMEFCEQAGVPFGCTDGLCGTCICRVVSGHDNLSMPTEAEINFIGEIGVEEERMMCQTKILQGTVEIIN